MILAAGGSRRLGQPKQLLKLRGEALLCRALHLAHGLTPGRVVVVVGAQRLRIRLFLRRWPGPRTRVVDNARWRNGMASSLQRGLGALPARCRAALLLLVDQPGLQHHSLEQLTQRWRQHPRHLIAAYYNGRPGVPAIVPRRYWSELKTLSGDRGARALLRARRAELIAVPMPEAAWDIDRPADLARL